MEFIDARSIFSPATGFIARGGFDFTCNPYVGCTFGCIYCYAMFLPQNRRPKEDWGRWLVAKQNAVAIAEKAGHQLAGKALYASSVTDPYLPAERSLLLTRGILESLVRHQPRLVVQTRGPLVVRDIDVLRRFHHLRVNISIPTDDPDVWSAFEPKSPPLEQRWLAAHELKAAGLKVGLCLTPLLPLRDCATFVNRVASFEPDVLVLQEFHVSKGAFGADTGETARQLCCERHWGPLEYRETRDHFRRRCPLVLEGEAGFFPP